MPRTLPENEKLPRSRAPNGVDSKLRIRVALLSEERKELERLAFAEGRSVSSLARIYLLRGMRAERRHTVLTDEPINSRNSPGEK